MKTLKKHTFKSNFPGSEKEYPFQNNTPANIPGEIWKDIPGFEGSFQASNKGRIRSLDRTVPHARCGTQFVKGRILKPNIKRHPNVFKGDEAIILQVTLMLENIRHEYSIKRLVYAAFKKETFNLNSPKMIVPIDGNGYNNMLSNLRMVDNSERMKMIVRRNRMPKRGKVVPGTIIKPTFTLWKPIHQCNLKGRILATYPCIAYAAKANGYYDKGIISVAKGTASSYKGFKWKYASRKYLQSFIKNWQNFRLSGFLLS